MNTMYLTAPPLLLLLLLLLLLFLRLLLVFCLFSFFRDYSLRKA